MRIVLAFDEDDPLPCICKIRGVQTAFPTAVIVVDPAHVGRIFAAKLQRAQVQVELQGEK